MSSVTPQSLRLKPALLIVLVCELKTSFFLFAFSFLSFDFRVFVVMQFFCFSVRRVVDWK